MGSWVTFCPIFELLSLSQCELVWVLIGPPIHKVESRLQGGGKSPGEAMGGGGIFF